MSTYDAATSPIQSHFLALSPQTTIQSAIAQMAEAAVSCVLVVEEKRLKGIFTERDVVRLTTAERLPSDLLLADHMATNLVTLHPSETEDIFSLSRRFSQHRVRHLPVLDDAEQIMGLITPESLRQALKPEYLLRHLRVGEVVSSQVVHAEPDITLLELSTRMVQHRISCIVIAASQARQPLGIITERDVVKFHHQGLDFGEVPVHRVMSTPLSTVELEDSLWAVHQRMQAMKVRRLVAVESSGELAGVVTQTQMLKMLDPVEMHHVMQQMQDKIEHQTRELVRLNQDLKASNEKLTELSNIDELTQTANRRRLNVFLEQEWQRLSPLAQPLSVLMCDVDYFKAYNDTYGHLAGDECLWKIAQTMRSVTWQSSDLVARYGGEEFVVVLPNTDRSGVENVARKIQAKIQALKISHKSSNLASHVTLSLGGLTVIPDRHSSPAMVLNTADQLLYQAKQQGRNCYILKTLVPPEHQH